MLPPGRPTMTTAASAATAKSQRVWRLALLVALSVPWSLIWQGVDVTDQGYLLTIYRQFLKHPEAVNQAAHMWLTNEVGAIWDALFGSFGVVAHRALWALCLSSGLFIAFRAVSRVTSVRMAALSVLAASLFLCNRRETWFSYNVLTALINAGAVALMTRGLLEERDGLLFLSGALLGASPFARFPNVLGLALLSGPIFLRFIQPARGARTLRDVSCLLLGTAAGVLGVALAIAASGGWSVYSASLRGLFAPAVSKTGHGTSALLTLFVADQASALIAGAFASGMVFGAHLLLRSVPKVARWTALTLVGVLCVWGLLPWGSSSDPELWRRFVVGSCYVVLALTAFGVGGAALQLRVLSFLALVALVVTPLGSDQGTRNAHWGLWLALPSTIAALGSLDGAGPKLHGIRDLAFLLMGVVGIEGLHRIRDYTYREASRERLTEAVPIPQLRWQLTTAHRARVLAEVSAALEARVHPGDYLLTSESVPLLQYLTRTRPYLGIPWIMVDEDPGQLAELFERAPREKGCLPVLVRARGNARSPAWPDNVAKGLDRHHTPARRVIAAFLRRHGYETAWKNSFFEILEPRAENSAGRPCR